MRGLPAAASAIVLFSFAPCLSAQQGETESAPGILSRVWLSGQANFVAQGHPSFHSPYSGPNSFQAKSEIQTSRVLTLYTGIRLTSNTDFLFDLEATNGNDLSGGHGLAGFTNLDIAGVPNDQPYIARAVIHHVFPLGSDSVQVGRGPLLLADRVPARRIDLYFGKMSLLDFFDVNAVGSDSHYQFLNWTVDNNAAYGYPADSRGYTYGVVGEYHERMWALRFGEALTPKISDPDHLDADLARSRSENLELEVAHNLIPKGVGLLRFLFFADHGALGDYREAIDAYLAGRDPMPDITSHRETGHTKYGWGFNFEQELNRNLRVFGRMGWAEGHKESVAFTEANQSISGGGDVSGRLWGRAADRLGAAFSANGLSGDHRRYLALGGLGALLGDGRLNYAREEIFETYYTVRLWRGVYASADVQRIWNPGYNADRGPVTVAAIRLHVEGAIYNNPR